MKRKRPRHCYMTRVSHVFGDRRVADVSVHGTLQLLHRLDHPSVCSLSSTLRCVWVTVQ